MNRRSALGYDASAAWRLRSSNLMNLISTTPSQSEQLSTTIGDFPLQEYRLRLARREWVALHTDAILTHADEVRFLSGSTDSLPYGVALWPAAVALAHEVATRADALRGVKVLELGAGTGLPGIVAATLGARVVQTDRQKLAMHVCQLNAQRNGVRQITHRIADWTAWDDPDRYDLIIGSDILYADTLHPHLRRIFAGNLSPGGKILLSDPFRADSLKLLEAMQSDGWRVTLTKWTVGEEADARAIGVYELKPPA
jgi:predicted nicotinamide N-methyase